MLVASGFLLLRWIILWVIDVSSRHRVPLFGAPSVFAQKERGQLF
jgi:hypothetical protein